MRALAAAVLLLATATGGAGVGRAAEPDPVAAADPFIGTGADGHTFPGAVAPFGMVQLSPDTLIADFKHSYAHAAGYRYEDRTIQGFSHTHFSGAGHCDLGDVSLMPITGEVKLDPGDPDKPGPATARPSATGRGGQPRLLRASRSTDYRVRAELTATPRVGVHRYTFPQGAPAHVLLDLRHVIYDYPGKVLWSQLRLRADGAVTGMRETRGWAPGRRLYFACASRSRRAGHALYDREPVEAPYKGFAPPGHGLARHRPSCRAAAWSACSTSPR